MLDSHYPDSLKKKMMESDVISFDIFDTLVERIHHKPEDIFTIVGKKVLPLHQGNAFTQLRKTAETKAREKAQSLGFQEVTLEAIYQELIHLYPISQELIKQCMAMELETERHSVRPRQAVKSIYDKAVVLGKEIILISDMYLPLPTIEQLLTHCEYTKHTRVFLSSEARLSKHHGALFKHVQSHYKEATSILHIGDNEHADGAQAERQGLSTFHIPKRVDAFHENYPLQTSLLQRVTTGDAIRLGMLGTPSTTAMNGKSEREQYFYLIGHQLMGPLLMSMLREIDRHAQKSGHSMLACLARDGMIVHLAAERMKAAKLISINSQYLWASRRCVSLPFLKLSETALTDCFEDLIFNASTISEMVTVLPFSLTDQNTTELKAIRRSKNRTALNTFFANNKHRIHPALQEERTTYRSYIQSMLPGKTILFDIGWKGSLLRGLENAHPNAEFTGYFFGTESDALTLRSPLQGYYAAFGQPLLRQRILEDNREAIEYLFSATHNSVIRITSENKNSFTPVFTPSCENEVIAIQDATAIHQGCCGFFDELERILSHESGIDFFNTFDGRELLDHFLTRPERTDIQYFGSARLLSGIGDKKGKALIKRKMG